MSKSNTNGEGGGSICVFGVCWIEISKNKFNEQSHVSFRLSYFFLLSSFKCVSYRVFVCVL